MGSSSVPARADFNSPPNRVAAPTGSLSLEEIVGQVRVVPVAPEIFPKLQTLLDDLESEIGDVARLINLDAGLATLMLKTANTAYYARGESVVSVEDAISRVGFEETFRLVVRCSYASVLRGDLSCYGISGEGLWRNAVAAAFSMQHICRVAGVDEAIGYAAGLLHSVGMSAIDDFLKRHAKRPPRFSGSGRAAILEWENSTIGFDHAAVGAAMLRQWQVPGEIADAVGRQLDDIPDADEPLHSVLLPVGLMLGQHVEALCDESDNPVAPFEPRYDEVRLKRAGLTEERLEGITDQVCKVWRQAREAIR